MLVVYEVHLAPGGDPGSLLTDDIKRDTSAQIMTLDEAKAVGFDGLPDPKGAEVRLIAVNVRDARWVERALDQNDGVAGFKRHDVG